MTRVVSLFLPSWSTDRLRRKAGDAAPPAEAPLVLIGRDGNRRVVLAADAAARAAGLRAGMPVTKAQVLVPGLIVQDADPAADHGQHQHVEDAMHERDDAVGDGDAREHRRRTPGVRTDEEADQGQAEDQAADQHVFQEGGGFGGVGRRDARHDESAHDQGGKDQHGDRPVQGAQCRGVTVRTHGNT